MGKQVMRMKEKKNQNLCSVFNKYNKVHMKTLFPCQYGIWNISFINIRSYWTFKLFFVSFSKNKSNRIVRKLKIAFQFLNWTRTNYQQPKTIHCSPDSQNYSIPFERLFSNYIFSLSFNSFIFFCFHFSAFILLSFGSFSSGFE